MKRLIAGLGAAALMAAGCGGGTPSGSGSDTVKVGLITKTETNPFFVKMKEGATAAAKAQGAELMSAAGKFDGDNASQITAIENMVAAGVKGILITPSDTKAIVPAIKKARDAGVLVIALDTPTEPQDATDALFATDNFKAGELIGQYAKAAMAGKPAKIATLDLAPGITVGKLRHDGFLKGFGVAEGDPSIVCSQDTQGDQSKGQTAMENCLQKAPDINLVYTINEPARPRRPHRAEGQGHRQGRARGLRRRRLHRHQGRQERSDRRHLPAVPAEDGGESGVKAVTDFAKGGKKATGYTDTGVTLITDKPVAGVAAKDTAFGLANCWG
ncbi:substrate-binding domain-containing protein [Nonomuraea dietziae]|uniref:substrate-binding domain-containing protein n=1 Tax=Nonomuraea dietziae TaxID=65515 RepID=UPI0031D393B7